MLTLAGPGRPNGVNDPRLYDGIADLYPPSDLANVLSTMALSVGTSRRKSLLAMGQKFGESQGACEAAIDEAIANKMIAIDSEGIVSVAQGYKWRHTVYSRSRFHSSPIWDGTWIELSFPSGIDSVQDPTRMRQRLLTDHFRELEPDIWIRPNNLEDLQTATAGDLASKSVAQSTRQIENPRRTAAQLWNLDALCQRATEVVEAAESLKAQTPNDTGSHLPQCWILGCAMGALLERDPLLPPALLPRPWAVAKIPPTIRMLSLHFRSALVSDIHMDYPPGS